VEKQFPENCTWFKSPRLLHTFIEDFNGFLSVSGGPPICIGKKKKKKNGRRRRKKK